jgi:hypothetical protein
LGIGKKKERKEKKRKEKGIYEEENDNEFYNQRKIKMGKTY